LSKGKVLYATGDTIWHAYLSVSRARVILGGIELVHMMHKGQAKYACNADLSLAEQFEALVA
jgi:hypothetical protein